jgi:hypothetical protein
MYLSSVDVVVTEKPEGVFSILAVEVAELELEVEV